MKDTFREIKNSYIKSGRPLLPVTRFLQVPMRWYFHSSPLLRHDSVFHLKPFLLNHFHDIFCCDHPIDFYIYGEQIKFRSYGSQMSVQAYYIGEVEYHLLQYLLKDIKDDFVMFDVGGHHGVYALIFAYELRKRGWKGVIHTFEPHRENFNLLEYNVLQNDLSDYVVLHNQGVSNFSGAQRLCLHTRDNSGNFLDHDNTNETYLQNSYPEYEVKVVKLDDFLHGINHVDLIKLDIQGGEANALLGAKDMIAQYYPKIAIEAYDGALTTSHIQKVLIDYKYQAYGVTKYGDLCSTNSSEVFVSWDWIALPCLE